jgi:hypothetical protein
MASLVFSSRFRSDVSIAMEGTKPLEGGVAFPGVALPGVLGSIQGLTQAPTPATPDTLLKKVFNSGFPLPLWAHLFLTGMIPGGPLIPYLGPFVFSFLHTFGINGVNLLVSNALSWAAAKALLGIIMTQIANFVSVIYSDRWWMPYMKNFLVYGNPWFVFDIIQVVGAVAGLNEPFKMRGYKIPFLDKQVDSEIVPPNKATTNKSIGFMPKPVTNPDGSQTSGTKTFGLLWSIPIAAILVLFMPALTLMSANLPPEIKAQIDPLIANIFWVVGLVSGIVGGTLGVGGLATFTPTILSWMKPDAIAAAVTQAGGGATDAMPSVKDIADSLIQKGGAKKEGGEASAFMGILGFTVVAGIGLALVRGKQMLPSK